MFHPGWTNDVLLSWFSIETASGISQGQYSSSHVFAQAVGRWNSIDDKGMDRDGFDDRLELRAGVAFFSMHLWAVTSWRSVAFGVRGGHNLETKPVGEL